MRQVRDAVLREVTAGFGEQGIEMPAEIVVLQGSPSLKAALRDDGQEPTPGGGTRPSSSTLQR